MSIRLRIDRRKWIVTTQFNGEVGLPAFGRYAREFAQIPISDTPFIYFADGTRLTKFDFSNLQMMPHAEQIVARLAHGGDMAAVVLLATTPDALESAYYFREIAADSFPVQVYSDVDSALDRLNELLKQVPKQRRVPTREIA